MTDPSITRADARHEERIVRENRRQALNHAVRLSNGLDPDSTLEAATRFARFLDGEGRRDAGTDAAGASADYWPPLRIRMDDGSVEEVSIQKPPMPDVLRSALADESIPDEMTYTWLGTPVEGLNQSVIDLIDAALRWRRHAPAAVVGPYATALAQAIDKLDPTAPVTEQHGDTERPIRASVALGRYGDPTLVIDDADVNHDVRKVRVAIAVGHQAAVYHLADAINGTDR